MWRSGWHRHPHTGTISLQGVEWGTLLSAHLSWTNKKSSDFNGGIFSRPYGRQGVWIMNGSWQEDREVKLRGWAFCGLSRKMPSIAYLPGGLPPNLLLLLCPELTSTNSTLLTCHRCQTPKLFLTRQVNSVERSTKFQLRCIFSSIC